MKVEINKIQEDGVISSSINTAGSGQIEGIGVGQNGEPGIKKKLKKLRDVIISKTPLKRIMGNDR